MKKVRFLAAVLLTGAQACLVYGSAAATPASVTAVTVSDSGTLSTTGQITSVNGDGTKVLFGSSDGTLDSQFLMPNGGMYMRDTQTNDTVLESINQAGQPFGMEQARINRDGTKIVFISTDAAILVPQTVPFGRHLFIKDLQTGDFAQIDTDGQGNVLDRVNDFAIAEDSSTIVFNGGTPGLNVYEYHLATGTVSALPIHGTVTGVSNQGRYISYVNYFSDVGQAVKRYDTVTGEDLVISLSDTDSVVRGFTDDNARGISADGNRVLFTSDGQVVAGHSPICTTTGGALPRAYVRDVSLGITYIADVTSSGADPTGCIGVGEVDLSPDGYKVIFKGSANYDNNGSTLAFFSHNFVTGQTVGITRNALGQYIDPISSGSDISGDGTTFGFSAYGTNVSPSNGNYQGYIVPTEPSNTGTVNLDILAKRSLVPSLANGDVLPGLNQAGQTDKLVFDVNAKNLSGSIDPSSNVNFVYDTGHKCNSSAPTNCHNTSFTSSTLGGLSFSGANFSQASLGGQGTISVDGVSAPVTYSVAVQDGDRLTPAGDDTIIIKIFNLGDNPATATPIYRASSSLSHGSGVKIQ